MDEEWRKEEMSEIMRNLRRGGGAKMSRIRFVNLHHHSLLFRMVMDIGLLSSMFSGQPS